MGHFPGGHDNHRTRIAICKETKTPNIERTGEDNPTGGNQPHENGSRWTGTGLRFSWRWNGPRWNNAREQSIKRVQPSSILQAKHQIRLRCQPSSTQVEGDHQGVRRSELLGNEKSLRSISKIGSSSSDRKVSIQQCYGYRSGHVQRGPDEK